MKPLHSIFKLEILFHIYCTPSPLENEDSPGTQSNVKELITMNLIRRDEESKSGYKTTEKGNKYIDMLLNTPYPELILVDPREYKRVEI